MNMDAENQSAEQSLPLSNLHLLVLKGPKDRLVRDPEKSLNQKLKKILNLLRVERKTRRGKGSLDLDLPALSQTLVPMGTLQIEVVSAPNTLSKDNQLSLALMLVPHTPVHEVDYEGHSDSLTDS